MTPRPIIIEAAISGRAGTPHSPISPDQIASDAMACLTAGAAIIHNHVEDIRLTGVRAASRYMLGWRSVIAQHPEVILCPTTTAGAGAAAGNEHQVMLAGIARMGVIDPGSVNLGSSSEDGLPGTRRFVYTNSYDDIEQVMKLLRRAGLGPSIAIYEPGWLRVVLAYERAGQLPRGTMIKLYFGGDRNWLDGRPGGITFGLPPTAKALDAYLGMLEGSGLPWAVAVLGGDVVRTGLAQRAIDLGGHIRVGLEDYGGHELRSNAELVGEAAALIRAAGHRVATLAETADLLDLPPASAA